MLNNLDSRALYRAHGGLRIHAVNARQEDRNLRRSCPRQLGWTKCSGPTVVAPCPLAAVIEPLGTGKHRRAEWKRGVEEADA